MRTPRHLTWIAAASTLILAASAAAQPATALATAQVHFTIGPDTTRVTGPVLADGTIDYVAALSAHLSAGVTPDNNAFPLILRALGPGLLPESNRARILAALDLTDLPEQDPYPKYWTDSVAAYDVILKHIRAPWREADQPALAAWLQAYGPNLQTFAQAVQRPRYWVPTYADPKDPVLLNLQLASLGPYRRTANVLGARVMLRLGSGDLAGTRDDLMTLHHLARLTAQARTAIEVLVAIAIDALASYHDLDWAGDSHVTAAQAREYLAQLQALPPMPSFHDTIDMGERFQILDLIMDFHRKGNFSSLTKLAEREKSVGGNRSEPDLPPDLTTADLDWDGLLRMVNPWYDRLAAIADKPYVEQIALCAQFKDDLSAFHAKADADLTHRVGKAIVGMDLLAFNVAYKQWTKGVMKFELTEVALAARAYYADKGQWPQNLTDLVPAYLKAIPADRFGTEPLQMRLDNSDLLIWSVGPDGNGYTGDEAKDIAVRLHVK